MAENKINIIIEAIDRTTATVKAINGSIARIAAPARATRRALSGLVAQSGFKKIAKATDDVMRSFRGIATSSLIATGAIGGMFYALKRVSNSGEEAIKAAQRFGTTIPEWQRLAYAAFQADISTDDLGQSLGALNKNAIAAATGNQKSAIWFSRAGISVKDQNGHVKTSVQLLAELSDVFEKMPDGPKKLALANALLKDSQGKMVPLLNGGSKALRAWGDEAERKGLVDEKADRAGDAFNTGLKGLQASVKGVSNSIGGALFPALTGAIGHLTKWIDENRVLIAQIAGNFGPVVAAVAGLIAGKLVWSVYMLVKSIKTLGLVTAVTPFGLFMIAIAGIVALIYVFRKQLSPLGAAIADVFSSFGGLFGGLFSTLQELWTLIGPVLMPVIKALAGLIVGTLSVAFQALLFPLRVVIETLTFGIGLVTKLIKGVNSLTGSGALKFNQALMGVGPPAASAIGAGGGAIGGSRQFGGKMVVELRGTPARVAKMEASDGLELEFDSGLLGY